jgi:hypothetical protein
MVLLDRKQKSANRPGKMRGGRLIIGTHQQCSGFRKLFNSYLQTTGRYLQLFEKEDLILILNNVQVIFICS